MAPATTYTYDARGRISTVKQGATVAATYLYDFAQHRVASLDAAAAQVHTLFDDEGHLLAEYDALSNNLLREYVWAGDMVLAMATGAVATPAWSYVTTGHLNEPVMVTNQSAAITSSVTRDPWGNTILIAGTNAIALGYPGQWKDLAGGLYHNWHRDYDPTLGRYLEPDPIGLRGGSNLYGYVGGNPVNLIDPEGTKVTVIASNPQEAKALMEAYHRLNQSRNGRGITKPLEDSSIDYQIRPVTKDAFFCPPGAGRKCKDRRGNTVYVDPCNRLKLPTTKGMLPADLEIVLAHELGHALGKRDDGPRRMNNVNANENPVRRDFGYPERTSYTIPKCLTRN